MRVSEAICELGANAIRQSHRYCGHHETARKFWAVGSTALEIEEEKKAERCLCKRQACTFGIRKLAERLEKQNRELDQINDGLSEESFDLSIYVNENADLKAQVLALKKKREKQRERRERAESVLAAIAEYYGLIDEDNDRCPICGQFGHSSLCWYPKLLEWDKWQARAALEACK